MMGRWQFRPPLWASMAVVPLAALLASLAFWQWDRGQQKERLVQAYLAADTATPLRLGQGTSVPVPGAIRKAEVLGTYETDRELFLDNQGHERRPGLRVWTPLRLPDGVLLMVDRGWLPVRGDRSPVGWTAAPTGEQRVTGYWRALPEPALRLGSSACEPPTRWPAYVQYPTHEELTCRYGEAVLPGLLLLDASAAGGFTRAWTSALTAVPPQRHYGYALQWAAFCLTLLSLFIILNLKKRP